MIDPTKLSQLSDRYLAALRTHFEQGPQADSQAAHRLGKQAVTLGLETLELAKIHDGAVHALVLSGCPVNRRKHMTSRATVFFTEASAPIEMTHRIALDLADSNRKLKKEVLRSQAVEKNLRASGAESVRLLAESRHLQEYLQNLAHQILSTQEDERKKMSLKLQDEIAQTLLGIHIRLLALKQEVTSGRTDFEKEIATTQRLVQKSVRTINRLAREFGTPHENSHEN